MPSMEQDSFSLQVTSVHLLNKTQIIPKTFTTFAKLNLRTT